MKSNKISVINNYAFTRKTDIDTELLTDVCLKIYEQLKLDLNEQNDDYVDDSYLAPLTTRCYNQYNLLSFLTPPLHMVYTTIRDTFREILDSEEKDYFLQCWLNIFTDESPALGWHSHFEDEKDAFHGFLVVKADESYTEYKKPDKSLFKIPSSNGLLVLTKSYKDLHRTSPIKAGQSRITIAFDIVKFRSLSEYFYESTHWIPI